MRPFADTLSAMLEREAFALVLWVNLVVLPLLVPLVLAIARKPRLNRPVAFAWSAGARIVGYPTMLTLLFVVPWFIFEVFLVPVLFEAAPASKAVLATPLSLTRWLTWHWFWYLPFLWFLWVTFASFHLAKKWRVQPTEA
jgi:hypothetical protein